ncbi:hypothetical protein [Nonlabens marinus]|uniref:Restriction endonuclease n=1 Tax=Nonlabens marinus S1-08 TaxID=1454201 RepID=W8VW92_9FLAO|nr:hypothetical protein [Nonlabens marinus]BAO56123.1 hypothetical protein NMS_2114 [Nonlabens marinus S1-08]
MANPISFIKRVLLGYKKPKYKLIQMNWSMVQKLDFSLATKNPDGSTSIELTKPHPSFIKSKFSKQHLSENEVLDWIIGKKHLYMLINEIFYDLNRPIYSALELREPYVDPKSIPGDLDMVLFQNPDHAIGFECKVIKFDHEKRLNNLENSSRAFNKLKGIDKGWKQLDGYNKLGFHKTYLLLIILDDQSSNKAEGQISRRIHNKIVTDLDSLNKESQSGILIYYISQITPYEFNVQNIVRLEKYKEAIPSVQKESLTTLIIDRLKDFDKLSY